MAQRELLQTPPPQDALWGMLPPREKCLCAQIHRIALTITETTLDSGLTSRTTGLGGAGLGTTKLKSTGTTGMVAMMSKDYGVAAIITEDVRCGGRDGGGCGGYCGSVTFCSPSTTPTVNAEPLRCNI